MPSAYSIPEIYEQEIEGAVWAGYYSNKSEVVRDALRNLFDARRNLRIAAAVELYQRERVTLSRAAEIACLNFFEFKDILAQRGIKVMSPGGTKDELDEEIRNVRARRK